MSEREVTGPAGPATTTIHHANDDDQSVNDFGSGAAEEDLRLPGLLNILQFSVDEFMSVNYHDPAGRFCSVVKRPGDAIDFIRTLPVTDTWFGVNPVKGPPRDFAGRGKADDVTRLTALIADLDFKESGCGSPEVGWQVIEDLAGILGTPPSAVIESGHGLQPYWPVYYHEDRQDTAILLKRWGRLVAAVASQRGAKVDNVFDLSRIFRVPGSFNCKRINGHDPIPVVGHRCDDGKHLSLEEIDRVLISRGVFSEPEDSNSQVVLSKPDGWAFGESTCAYVGRMVAAIPTDEPLGGRHQMIADKAVRLMCAVRLGCITEGDFERAQELLYDRLLFLRQQTGETVPPNEIPSLIAGLAVEKTSWKTDEQCWAELGNHTHPDADPLLEASVLLAERAGDPIPLTQKVVLPPFPVDAFPVAVANMVKGVADFTQTDPAMPAAAALATLSVCTGGHATVQVRPGWYEPLHLYLVNVAHSAERKSAVHQMMTSPIHDVEVELIEREAPGRREAQTRKQIAEGMADRLRRAAARPTATPEAIAAAVEADRAAEQIHVPVLPRLLADDVTPEAAATLVCEQGGRLAIFSTEGGFFDILNGRYAQSNIPNLDLWLKGHSGDPVKVDRKNRPPEHIPRPAITLGLMMQPQLLTVASANQNLSERGLLARILFSFPASKLGRRDCNPSPVGDGIRTAYNKLVSTLARETWSWGAVVATLRLSDEANKAVLDLQQAVEPTLAGDGELASLPAWGGKYIGAVVRIAGILHLAEHGANDGASLAITEETILKASRIGEYFKAAAIRAFSEMGADQITNNGAYLVDRISHLGGQEVSERDLFSMCSRTRFRTMTNLRPVITRLIDHRCLMPVSGQRKTGGRPSSGRYLVNPRIAEVAISLKGS